MTKNYFLSITFLLISFFGFSQAEYLDGILVLNEGNMGTNAANISFVSENNTITNGIFSTANSGAVMGDVGQSITMYEDIAIIVMNASNEIHFVNNKTFELITTIDENVVFPRYTAVYDGKAYVTCWGQGNNPDDDYVAVIDLVTYQIESTIPFQNGIENIIEVNGKLYIAHQGGYSTNNIVSVYDIATQITTIIQVNDVPREFVLIGDYLYLVTAGLPYWSPGGGTNSSLVKINTTDNTTIEFDFDSVQGYHSAFNGDYIYISAGSDVYRFNLTTEVLESTAFIATPVTDFMGIYGLDIVDDKIYVSDANGYGGAGFVYVYSLDGVLLTTLTVGNIPNAVIKSAKSENASVIEQNLASVSVYPNPTTDVFYVKSDKDLDVTIFDIQGKVVKRATSIQNGINVSDLSKGMYLVELSNATQKQIVKLVIR